MRNLTRFCLAWMLVLALGGTSAAQSTWYVNVNSSNPPPGTGTQSDPYHSIQYAIGQSSTIAGDTVLVMPGRYLENLDYLGKGITVASMYGHLDTIIDGSASSTPESCVRFVSGEGRTAVLAGFTLTGGTGHDWTAYTLGGGIYIEDASPTIMRNLIRDNAAAYGGGIWCRGSGPSGKGSLIVNNIFVGNTAGGVPSHGYGGAICCDEDVQSEIYHNTIYGNQASIEGGGISFLRSRNQTVVENNIIWANTGGQVSKKYTSNPIIQNNDIEGDPSQMDLDPLFVDPTAVDFHLRWSSPCIDMASILATPTTEDWEGDPRPGSIVKLGSVPDIGADEYDWHVYSIAGIVSGGAGTLRLIGDPAAAGPFVLYLGNIQAGVRDNPLGTQYGDLWLYPPYGPMGFFSGLSAAGFADLPGTIPSKIAPGTRLPVQVLIGPLGQTGTFLSNLLLLLVW